MKKKDAPSGYDFCAFLDYNSSNDFELYEIGNYKCPPGYSYGPVIRSRSIFHYVYSGTGILRIGDKEFPVYPGQAFYIPAGEKAFYQADQDDPWTYYWHHVSGPMILDVTASAGITVDNPIFCPTGEIDIMENIINSITANHDREYYCIGKLYELSDYMISHSPNAVKYQKNIQLSYVQKIIRFIQLKYSEPIQVSDIANMLSLNRSHMTRLFKKATGTTIQEYLISYRMKVAMKMMEDPICPINHISFAVGYNDVFTFSKAFKQHVGVSPSDYRKTLESDTSSQEDS
jgi:AraC-like DNA-binding protein